MRRLLILALSAVALTTAASADGSFPGTNGRLAYFYAAEIWTLGADGTAARSLGAGLSPAWSPNGRSIAFDTLVERNYDVWTMRADGSGRRRVTQDPAPDYFASWSPDGASIVFTSDRGGEDLFVIGADGSGERRLTDHPGPDWGAAWSPDGMRIAFAGNANGNLEVEVVNVDGTGRVALTNHPSRDYDPAWSPDATRIAFTSERDGNANVYVMNSDGTGVSPLTQEASGDWRPSWSPDGTLIAFESDRDEAVFDRDVYVMAADGTGVRRLRSGNVNARDVDWQPTVDLRLSLRRSGIRVTATVTNLTPVATRDVVVTVRIGRSRAFTLGALDASATRSLRFTVARRIKRIEAVVSGWHADPRPSNNRVVLRR
jgi:dipeptidyl aminopeptidase/acylaminoacyl peptidase